MDGDTIDCWIGWVFDLKIKKEFVMGIDTWESRTRDLDKEKRSKDNKELLEGVSKSYLMVESSVEC